MLELITILSLITLSLSWKQDYPDLITIATDNRLSQTDKRLSVLDNNINILRGQTHVKTLWCTFCIILKAFWQHKIDIKDLLRVEISQMFR